MPLERRQVAKRTGKFRLMQRNHKLQKSVAPEAERYYASGKPFLQRYLPYWFANVADRSATA